MRLSWVPLHTLAASLGPEVARLGPPDPCIAPGARRKRRFPWGQGRTHLVVPRKALPMLLLPFSTWQMPVPP